MTSHSKHLPVLLKEALESLRIHADGIYLDATYGRGGHSQEILLSIGAAGQLHAVDQDLVAVKQAQNILGEDKRFSIHHRNFADFIEVAEKENLLGCFDGVFLDLGVSSPQLDNPERGFSFGTDGPLDMRMNQGVGVSAQDWLHHVELEEMVSVFRSYGEERYSLKIARAIVKHRMDEKITTTMQLAEIVKRAHPKWERGKHPATRVFQAIRIEINGELDSLKTFLLQSEKLLKVGGRLVVISFHSLEDRMVKRFIRNGLQKPAPLRNLPMVNQYKHAFRAIGKPIYPGQEELDANNRSRSSVLRVAERYC